MGEASKSADTLHTLDFHSKHTHRSVHAFILSQNDGSAEPAIVAALKRWLIFQHFKICRNFETRLKKSCLVRDSEECLTGRTTSSNLEAYKKYTHFCIC